MISHTLIFLAQATPPAGATPKAADPSVNMLVMMAFAFGLIYLVSIRPQQKRQKELQARIAATKTGDKVVTASGIHGIIANVKERTFILKVADNVKIETKPPRKSRRDSIFLSLQSLEPARRRSVS